MKTFKIVLLAAMLCAVIGAAAQEAMELPLFEDIPPSAGFGDNPPDILGVHLGDKRDDVIAALQAKIPGIEFYPETYRIEAVEGDIRMAFNYTGRAKGYVSGDVSEEIVLAFTSEVTGGRLYEIERKVTYAEGHLASAAEVLASIDAKFGKPTAVEVWPNGKQEERTYSWETGPVEILPEVNVETVGFGGRAGDMNPCVFLIAKGAQSVYWLTGAYPYTRFLPGERPAVHADTCVGGVRIRIYYGPNPNVISMVSFLANDYARAVKDNRTLDELIAAALDAKAGAVTGSGAPAL